MKTALSILVLMFFQIVLAPALFFMGRPDFVFVAIFDPPLSLLIAFGQLAGCQSQEAGGKWPAELMARLCKMLFFSAQLGYLVYKYAEGFWAPFARCGYSLALIGVAFAIVASWRKAAKGKETQGV